MKGKSKKMLMFVSLALILSTALFGTLAYLTSKHEIVNTFTVGNVNLKLDESLLDEDGKGILVDKETGKPIYKDVNGEKVPVTDLKDVPNGVVVDRTEEGNKYKLIPGKTYVKDPTVTVLATSEEAYVRMLVTFDHAKELKAILDELGEKPVSLVGYDDKTWKCQNENPDIIEETATSGSSITYEFRYIGTEDGKVRGYNEKAEAVDVSLKPLFTAFAVSEWIDGEQLQTISDMQMTVKAHAIQAEGFEADAATGKTAADVAWEAFDKQMSKKQSDTQSGNNGESKN